jgi:acyl-CoA thioester hydrolase
MQECLFDWIYSTGLKFSPNNKAPVLAATSCKFIRPIVFPAGIAIELYAVGKDGKKIKFSHTIRDLENPEQVYALGEAEIIWFDFINNKSIHEPEEYRHLISG